MATANNIETLFLQHRSKMLRLATLLLQDEAEAEDAVSDVFAQIATTPLDIKRAEGFMLTAVRNRCINILHQRRKAETIPLGETEHATPTLEREETEERLQSIERFVQKKLTPQTQRVIWLRFKEHLKYSEIASELHISEAAVYKHLVQGLEKLRKHFNP